MRTPDALREKLKELGLDSQKVNLIFEDSPTYQLSEFQGYYIIQPVYGKGAGGYAPPPFSPSPVYSSPFNGVTKRPPQRKQPQKKAGPAPSRTVYPKSYGDVQEAVKVANREGAQIVVRSGGHSYESLSVSPSLNNYTFLIIDLKNLDDIKVEISEDKKSGTAWVEAGSKLGDIYKKLWQSHKSYAFPGGSCPAVGSGGHISGGGIGMLARKFGLAADNVLDVKLVDAEGNLRSRYGDRTSKAMGEDVFWAICGGGGGSWGVVVAWKIKVVKVRNTVTMFRMWKDVDNGDELINLIDRYQDFMIRTIEEDDDKARKTYIRFNVTNNTADEGPLTFNARFHGLRQGKQKNFIEYMKRMFPELGLRLPVLSPNVCKTGSWEDAVPFFAKNFGRSNLDDPVFPQKNRWKFMSDVVKKRMPIEGIRTMVDIIRNRPISSLVIHPLGGAINDKEEGETPFPYRKGCLYIIEYAFENVTRRELPTIEAAYETMRPYVSSKPRGAYINFADISLGYSKTGFATPEEARQWGEKYFGKRNYRRLLRAKKQIDPANVFRHAQSIPPADK